MTATIKLALAGAGLIGRRHVASITQCANVELIAIFDPSDAAKLFAVEIGLPHYHSLREMFIAQQPDGVIIATPNNKHVENGMECVAAKCPILVEKPIASDVIDAQKLVDAARSSNVVILVGHHRRHNPLIQKAHELIAAGTLGQLRAVHSNCWFYKPDDYFEEAAWRKQKGAGPISVNLVHDVDLIRYLCGDVVSVRAQAAPAARGFENEDVAAAVLTFANGAIGTITVSDAIVAPWSWELTAGENPAYPQTSQSSYLIGGTHGSLSLPDLTLWQNGEKRSWWEPISATKMPVEILDPLVQQILQFAAVIRGHEQPLVSGEEGLRSLRVGECSQRSAQTGETVTI